MLSPVHSRRTPKLTHRCACRRVTSTEPHHSPVRAERCGIGALQPIGSDRGLGRSCPVTAVHNRPEIRLVGVKPTSRRRALCLVADHATPSDCPWHSQRARVRDAADRMRPRMSGSQQTPRWREQDSNHRSRGRRPASSRCRLSFAPYFGRRGIRQRRHEPVLTPWSCDAVPIVRIRLPPALSHVRTRLPRSGLQMLQVDRADDGSVQIRPVPPNSSRGGLA